MEHSQKVKIPSSVAIWLLCGIIMVFFQVVIGGITRLTDSGLSITEWNLIKGVLPPLNQEQWDIAFKKYQDHTLQFKAIHADMTLSEFKFIYFWEWFHRLWARSMGFVFLFPFLFFWRKKYLPARLMRDLGIVVSLAALAAVFGWIMVQSGLNTEQFVWVNAYKLTIHLSIAITLLAFLWWATISVIQPKTEFHHNKKLRKTAWGITVVVCIQLVLGGLMSGMKAGLVAPHFPHMGLDQDGSLIWFSEVLFKADEWNWNNLFNYNSNSFTPAFVQVLHRGTAYLLCILIPLLYLKIRKLQGNKNLNLSNNLLLIVLIIQITLGIFTVINSLNKTVFPTLGVLHQAGGMLLLMSILFVNYQFSRGGYTANKS
jgi:cytochrome c oxidase assembly protein subunit 15